MLLNRKRRHFVHIYRAYIILHSEVVCSRRNLCKRSDYSLAVIYLWKICLPRSITHDDDSGCTSGYQIPRVLVIRGVECINKISQTSLRECSGFSNYMKSDNFFKTLKVSQCLLNCHTYYVFQIYSVLCCQSQNVSSFGIKSRVF